MTNDALQQTLRQVPVFFVSAQVVTISPRVSTLHNRRSGCLNHPLKFATRLGSRPGSDGRNHGNGTRPRFCIAAHGSRVYGRPLIPK